MMTPGWVAITVAAPLRSREVTKIDNETEDILKWNGMYHLQLWLLSPPLRNSCLSTTVPLLDG